MDMDFEEKIKIVKYEQHHLANIKITWFLQIINIHLISINYDIIINNWNEVPYFL